MWHAVDFTADRTTKAPFTDDTVVAIVQRMYQMGVIASPIGTALELAPPLISSSADLAQAADVTARAITEVARERHLV